MIRNFYGGNIPIIQQAAQEHGAQLLSADEYAIEDYPDDEEHDKEYVEGSRPYVFLLEAPSKDDAKKLLDETIHTRIRELAIAKGY
jgi:hypothetical protein